jgi:Protein of unknown function (DUF998)
MSDTALSRQKTAGEVCSPAGRVTRSLLGYGVAAGPFYVSVALAQALLRPGFNLAHDDVSLLSNGSFGWVQIANFMLTGSMVIACSVGLARALGSGPGATWAPRLIALYGAGLIAAGIFVADPMNGFPAGAPAGRPDTITVHGILHIVAAGIGFLGLIGGCMVMARRFAAEKRGRWAAFSIVTGIAFVVAFGGVASGSSSSAVVLGFWAALILAWAWLAAVSVHLYRRIR